MSSSELVPAKISERKMRIDDTGTQLTTHQQYTPNSQTEKQIIQRQQVVKDIFDLANETERGNHRKVER